MASKKITPDNLAEEIQKLLEEYGDEVEKNSAELTEKVAKDGAKALRSASGIFGGTGKYASGWKAKVTKGRLSTSAVIYNSKTPGLPHLLEFGHAKRNGGRVPGREHIRPVEQTIIESFVKEIEAKV